MLYIWASQVAQWVKNPPAMQETQETWVQSLGQEDPLEEGMATHSSIISWRIPWTEEPGGLQPIGLQGIRHDWACTHTQHAIWISYFTCIFIYCLTPFSPPTRIQVPSGQELCLPCFLLYPQSLEECLTHSRPSVNIWWMNELLRAQFSQLHQEGNNISQINWEDWISNEKITCSL